MCAYDQPKYRAKYMYIRYICIYVYKVFSEMCVCVCDSCSRGFNPQTLRHPTKQIYPFSYIYVCGQCGIYRVISSNKARDVHL